MFFPQALSKTATILLIQRLLKNKIAIPFGKCVDEFFVVLGRYSGGDEPTPEQLQLRDNVLRIHESGKFTVQEDISALKSFLESLIHGNSPNRRISRTYPVFAMNMLKYVMLSLGDKYGPNTAAVYKSELEPLVNELCAKDKHYRPLVPYVPVKVCFSIINILDEYKDLSYDEKLSFIDWFVSNPGDIVASVSTDPDGSLEKYLYTPHHWSRYGKWLCRERFDALMERPGMRTFYDHLVRELHRIY
ncbi:MAG: hypothetical protein LBQ43_05355 [Holosporales bacterium]|jgi:hypothetical protein|nr:hypothetical protein [Holosporales bacterium]